MAANSTTDERLQEVNRDVGARIFVEFEAYRAGWQAAYKYNRTNSQRSPLVAVRNQAACSAVETVLPLDPCATIHGSFRHWNTSDSSSRRALRIDTPAFEDFISAKDTRSGEVLFRENCTLGNVSRKFAAKKQRKDHLGENSAAGTAK